jgi:quercetin dioxygenase-like cupin family protein
LQIKNISEIQIQTEGIPIAPDAGGVTIQRVVTQDMTDAVLFIVANFEAGVKNKFHVHPHDQIVLSLSGKGIAATRTQEHILEPGMLAHIPKGEEHRHGALPEGPASLASIIPVPTAPTKVVD